MQKTNATIQIGSIWPEAWERYSGSNMASWLSDGLFIIMSAGEIRDAAARGMQIELHTHRHRISHDGQSNLTREIIENRDYLEPLLPNSPRHFCYPSGIYEEAGRPELEQLKIATATTTLPGLASSGNARSALPRILDGERVSAIESEAEIAGFGDLIRVVRRALSRATR